MSRPPQSVIDVAMRKFWDWPYDAARKVVDRAESQWKYPWYFPIRFLRWRLVKPVIKHIEREMVWAVMQNKCSVVYDLAEEVLKEKQ